MTLNSPAMKPDTLLAGPRGRRLCLKLAGLAAAEGAGPGENAFTSAMFYAAHEMDPDRGKSRVLFGPGAEDPPHPTAEETATLLDAVPVSPLTQKSLLTALTATVNSARYWQEPDGEDVLAASAPMRRALHRFAEHLLASPLVEWWMAPLDPAGQWVVTFVDDEPGPPIELRNSADTLAQWRLDTMGEEARAAKGRPADPAANWSGQWWSTPPQGLTHSTRMMHGRGPVGLWLVEDGFGQEEADVEHLEPTPGARVFEIEPLRHGPSCVVNMPWRSRLPSVTIGSGPRGALGAGWCRTGRS